MRKWGPLVLAPFLGFLAMLLPALLRQPSRQAMESVHALVRTAVKHVGPWNFVLLLLVGAFLGAISSWRTLVLGAAAMLLFPALAVTEMISDSTSHNLWPLEFLMYAFYGCVVAAGAVLLRRVGGREGRSR